MSQLLHRLRRRQFTVTVEVDPPRGPDAADTVQWVKNLKGRVDAFNVADCPLASVRMGPIALAHLLQQEAGVECVFHLTCRDRNLIGLQAELLGAAGLGVRNILCVKGDDPSRGEQPDALGVYQVDEAGLIRLAATLNRGRTLAGTELNAPTQFAIECTANPSAKNLDGAVDKLLEKIEAGATMALTQPVYDPAQVLRFQEKLAQRGLADFPILYGVMPFKSLKNAIYLRDKVPGVRVPEWAVERMAQGDKNEGIRIATEVVMAFASDVHGIHIFPLNSPRLVLGLLEALGEQGLREVASA